MGAGTVFKKIFPFISAAASLGGPLGVMAANAVGKAIGADSVAATPEAISAAIAGATPEQMLALKTSEQEFTLKMQELGFKEVTDLEKIAADDRASARAREVSVKDRIPAILAISVTGGFFGMLAALFYVDVPGGSRDLLNIMLGSLGTAWVSIISYYFGSSRGSDAKTAILAGAINGNGGK